MTIVPIADRRRQMASTKQHVYLRTHQISGPLLRFRLAGEEAALRDQAAVPSTTGRVGKTLVKEGALRIMQVMLRKGAALGSHEIASPASIQVLRGRLSLTTTDGELQLEAGDLVALDAGVAHAAEAASDCVLLITLASAARGGGVVKALTVEPIVGKRVLFRPDHVAIRLDERHRRAYRRLYGLFFPLTGIPALKDGDFDGRALTLTRPQLASLSHALASLDRHAVPRVRGVSGDQEQALTKHFKEMQFLS